MKRIIYFICLLLISPRLCFAAPCYGTKMPGKNKFHIGAQSYLVLQRYLEMHYGEMRSLQHFLLISYGVTNWLSLDLKGGAGYIKQHPEGSDEIDYPTYVGGGYGFRLTLYEEDHFKSVLGFQHISIHPYSIEVENAKQKAVLDDWQWSFLLSYELKKITPYLGVKWSRMDYIHWVDDVRKLKKSDLDRNVGLVAGFDLPVYDKIWLNIEGQFIDVQAVSFSVNFEF